MKKLALSVLLLSAFIDYAGIAIVFTIFSFLLFDPSLHFFPAGTSDATRGLWLGFLIALHPLMQFFSAPICGALSDRKGRKSLMKSTILLAAVGYLFAVVGVHLQSLWLLALYRILVGIGAGNSSVIAAMIGDISKPEEKSKNFGLLSMSMALGFIIAPFLSSLLTHNFGYNIPFYFPLALVIINYILVVTKLQESVVEKKKGKLKLFRSLTMIRRAFDMKRLRSVFLTHLLFSIGWSLFVEFSAIFLRSQFSFTATDTGIFYGYGSVFHALSAGLFIFPMVRRFGAPRVLFAGLLLSGLGVMALLTFHSRLILWFYIPLAQVFLSFVAPAASTVISDTAVENEQGEAMGIYHAVSALALGMSPLLLGRIAGANPQAAILLGGFMMLLAGLVFGLSRRLKPQESVQILEG